VLLWKEEQPLFIYLKKTVMIFAEKTESKSLEGTTINEQVFDLLEKTNTNWTVSQQPLFTADGLGTESVGIFKNDIDGKPAKWLGTKSEQYVPLQNKELAQTIVEASSGVGEIFAGGILQGGKKVFYQIAIPDYKVGTDTIKRWITGLNSHDGSTSIGFGSSNTVVICQNTFYRAYKEVQKFKHFNSAKDRLEFAKKQIQNTLLNDQSLMNDYERMLEFKIEEHKPIIGKVLDRLFDFNPIEQKVEALSTRKKNQLQQFDAVLDSELKSHGPTLWGLFNAVTYFENHVGVKDDKKLDRIMLGSAGRTMNATFNDIMAYIDANSVKKSIHVLS